MSSHDPSPSARPSGDPEPPDPAPRDEAEPVAPVNPGAWNTRSWTLVDATDSGSGPGSRPAGDGVRHVVWPEAGRADDAVALEADRVPVAQPPTGPHPRLSPTELPRRYPDTRAERETALPAVEGAVSGRLSERARSSPEELYARVPRVDDPRASRSARRLSTGGAAVPPLRAAGRMVGPLLPGALCVATFMALTGVVPGEPPYVRPLVALAGAFAVLVAAAVSMRGLPHTRTAALWCCWLLGYALYGDWLLAELLAGAPGTPTSGPGVPPVLTGRCVPLALACAFAPAAWGARLFTAAGARRETTRTSGPRAFAAGVRPLFVATVAVFTVVLLTVQTTVHFLAAHDPAPATWGATTALGVLLFLALLLSAHGFPRAASAGLATACVLVAGVLGAVLAARLPGLARLSRPVELAVATYGPSAVPAAVCGLVVLALLAYATRALTGASAHGRLPGPPGL